MKKPVSIKNLRFPTYYTRFCITVCKNPYHAADLLEDKTTFIYKDQVDKHTEVLTTMHTTNRSVLITIIVKHNSLPGDIAHECLHAMNMMYAHVGAKHSLTNDEPECYMLGWIVDQVHRQINLFKKKHLNQKQNEKNINTRARLADLQHASASYQEV